MEEMDYYEWEESKKRFTPGKIIKFIFKTIATIIIVGTFVLLLGRMWLMKIPEEFTGVTLTRGIAATLLNDTFDTVMQEPIEPYNNNGKSGKGWYHISNVALSESAGEVQLTVRYNTRSTINTLKEKYSLSEVPSGEVFVYVLLDDNGNVYTDYSFAAKSRMLYEFRRVIFTDVDLTDIKALYLKVYYINDVSSDGLMNAIFLVYDNTYGVEAADGDSICGKSLTFSDTPSYTAQPGYTD